MVGGAGSAVTDREVLDLVRERGGELPAGDVESAGRFRLVRVRAEDLGGSQADEGDACLAVTPAPDDRRRASALPAGTDAKGASFAKQTITLNEGGN